MGRYLSWLANAALLGLCSFLVANTTNTVFAALLTPAPDQIATAVASTPLENRSWADRRVILDRNLFDSAVVAPATPVAVEPEAENLEATRLPLDLLGTICSTNPKGSIAVVQDRKARENLVLKVDDEIAGTSARVERIECRRIVLREAGKLRELALSEDEKTPRPAPRTTASRRSAAANKRATRARRTARAQADQPQKSSMRAAAQLFSEAQILPKYENGQMVGVQVNAIQEGSMFEKLGFAEGDVITKLNDIEISSPEQSARVFAEFAEKTQFTVELDDGTVRSMALDDLDDE